MRNYFLNRVAIVGCRNVAATSVYSLVMNGVVKDVVLIDEYADSLLNRVIDLQQTMPMMHPVRLWAGDYAGAADADIAVISAGDFAHPGETPFGRLERNAEEIRSIVRHLKAVGFNGILIVTTNPVDVLTYVAREESGFPPEKVIGSGAVFEAAKLREILNDEIRFSCGYENNLRASGAEVATWCGARLGAAPFVEFCRPDCPDFPRMLERLNFTEITRRKSDSLIVASCVNRICEAILGDEQAIVPVSVLTDGQYGIECVYLSLPCVIGRNGVERIIELPFSENEIANLRASADLLKKLYSRLMKKETAVAASPHIL